MRGATVLLLIVLAASLPATRADPPVVEPYVGSTTRELLTGPVVLCDVGGTNVGGACFDAPSAPRVTFVVHDDHAPDWARVPLIIYAYGATPIAYDGDVECPVNHGAVTFLVPHYTTRIVVGVGPWAGAVATCDGVPGTSGTIEMHAWTSKQAP